MLLKSIRVRRPSGLLKSLSAELFDSTCSRNTQVATYGSGDVPRQFKVPGARYLYYRRAGHILELRHIASVFPHPGSPNPRWGHSSDERAFLLHHPFERLHQLRDEQAPILVTTDTIRRRYRQTCRSQFSSRTNAALQNQRL